MSTPCAGLISPVLNRPPLSKTPRLPTTSHDPRGSGPTPLLTSLTCSIGFLDSVGTSLLLPHPSARRDQEGPLPLNGRRVQCPYLTWGCLLFVLRCKGTSTHSSDSGREGPPPCPTLPVPDTPTPSGSAEVLCYPAPNGHRCVSSWRQTT